MKNIWMLGALFVLAGCQPDVPENPVQPPVTVAKSDVEPAAAATAPKTQAAPVSIEATPQHAKPVQPKALSDTATGNPEVVVAPSVEATAPISAAAEAETTAVTEPKQPPATEGQLSEAQAIALAKKKNCFACHALDRKSVGPAWIAVAEKYRGDSGAQAALESKVRKGGKGVWGSIAMPPQPTLSGEELTGLVRFVLQLK